MLDPRELGIYYNQLADRIPFHDVGIIIESTWIYQIMIQERHLLCRSKINRLRDSKMEEIRKTTKFVTEEWSKFLCKCVKVLEKLIFRIVLVIPSLVPTRLSV